jgi:hypothetical protein
MSPTACRSHDVVLAGTHASNPAILFHKLSKEAKNRVDQEGISVLMGSERSRCGGGAAREVGRRGLLEILPPVSIDFGAFSAY